MDEREHKEKKREEDITEKRSKFFGNALQILEEISSFILISKTFEELKKKEKRTCSHIDSFPSFF